MTSAPSVADIQRKVAEAAFGWPLITNALRGQPVETIVAKSPIDNARPGIPSVLWHI